MAMTKKEKAEYDAAILRVEMLAALRWTEPVERDVEPPSDYKEYRSGWDFNVYRMIGSLGSFSSAVYQAWTGSDSHGEGQLPEDKSNFYGSQNSCKLFSTREKALRALRHELEKMIAEKLLKVDKEIAKEKNQSTTMDM